MLTPSKRLQTLRTKAQNSRGGNFAVKARRRWGGCVDGSSVDGPMSIGADGELNARWWWYRFGGSASLFDLRQWSCPALCYQCSVRNQGLRMPCNGTGQRLVKCQGGGGVSKRGRQSERGWDGMRNGRRAVQKLTVILDEIRSDRDIRFPFREPSRLSMAR